MRVDEDSEGPRQLQDIYQQRGTVSHSVITKPPEPVMCFISMQSRHGDVDIWTRFFSVRQVLTNNHKRPDKEWFTLIGDNRIFDYRRWYGGGLKRTGDLRNNDIPDCYYSGGTIMTRSLFPTLCITEEVLYECASVYREDAET
jgi:hypothetical protein